MAHEFESGFFTRVPAWHKLGTVVQDAPTIGEAIKLAGLDWLVEERTLWCGDPVVKPDAGSIAPVNAKLVPTHKGLYRDSDGTLLGIVNRDYHVFQNAKAFNWFQPFLDSGLVKLDAAGSLRQGRTIWVLAKIVGADADVVKGDSIEGYLLLSNAHDGSQAVRGQFTTTRVVCANTLGSAHSKADKGIERYLSVRHMRMLDIGMETIAKAVDIAQRSFALTLEQYKALALCGCDETMLRKYVREVFDYKDKPEEDMPSAWEHIAKAYHGGPGVGTIPGVSGSWWAAYNAVTDWVDHGTGRGRGEDSRLHASWFGRNAVRRSHALELAVKAQTAAIR